jgi:hypothetical protein
MHGTENLKRISATSIFSVFLEIIHEFKIYEQQQNKRAVSDLAGISLCVCVSLWMSIRSGFRKYQ